MKFEDVFFQIAMFGGLRKWFVSRHRHRDWKGGKAEGALAGASQSMQSLSDLLSLSGICTSRQTQVSEQNGGSKKEKRKKRQPFIMRCQHALHVTSTTCMLDTMLRRLSTRKTGGSSSTSSIEAELELLMSTSTTSTSPVSLFPRQGKTHALLYGANLLGLDELKPVRAVPAWCSWQ